MPQAESLEPILAQREKFKTFLAARLHGSHADAEDLLQNSLAKALEKAPALRDSEKLVAWFYQILRNAVVDHVRSRRATQIREEKWTNENASPNDAEKQQICVCFQRLLPTLKPRDAELLRRAELEDQNISEVAAAMNLTANHASVALSRARAALRAKLVQFCGSCAEETCLDCDCSPDEQP
ncbi:MAG: sigma-70 family RNA polymerase sigma factor [Nibricoccus sp.]